MIEITCLDKDGNIVEHLTQWDRDQYIAIRGTELSEPPKVHFCNTNSKEALVVDSTIEDGIVTAKVPNILLQENLLILAYLYVYDPEISTVSAKTKATIRIPVRPRPKPSNYPYIENVDYISASKIEEKIENELASMRGEYEQTLSSIEVKYEELVTQYAETEGDLIDSFNKTTSALISNFSDGSPKGVFESETDLIGRESGLYLNETDGWVYYWDGASLSNGICQYQSSYPFNPPVLTDVSPDGTMVGGEGWTGTGFFCRNSNTRYYVDSKIQLPHNINGYNRFCLKPISDTEEWWNWTPFYTPLYEFFYVPARGVYEALIPPGVETPESVIENLVWIRKPPIQLVYGKLSYLIGTYQWSTSLTHYVKHIDLDCLRRVTGDNYPGDDDSAIVDAIFSDDGNSVRYWTELSKDKCIFLVLTSDVMCDGVIDRSHLEVLKGMASGEVTSALIHYIDNGFPGIPAVDMMPKIYGVSIDLTNSDPEAAVTYTDDAVGMTAGDDMWDSTNIFNGIRPCLFKNGEVVGYLNKNNFAQFEDGTSATINPNADGDVMIEIPKMGYKIATSGNTLVVQVTTAQNLDGFSYLAHTRQTEGDRDKLYIGAFLGGVIDGKLRSTIGNPTATNTSDDVFAFRTSAQANGAGYDVMSFYPLTLIQCLFLLKYKNLNSQAALGMGRVSGAPYIAGQTLTSGMDYGDPNNSESTVKFIGIEDLWGNLYQFIDGIKMSNPRYISGFAYVADFQAATDNFETTASYTTLDYRQINTSYTRSVFGTNKAGFLSASSGGSATTYYCDYISMSAPDPASFPVRIGGMYGSGDKAGLFCLSVEEIDNNPEAATGARLMYL